MMIASHGYQQQPLAAVNDASVEPWTPSTPVRVLWAVASLTGTIAGAYHGYKRNDSVGLAIGWALLGGSFPFITLPLSYAQGFGKPAK